MSFFNKSGGNGSNNSSSVSSQNNGLEPPKNLPDLARDLYEKDSITQKSSLINSESNTSNSSVNYSSSSSVKEPDRASVPRLDLSAMRQSMNQNNSVNPPPPQMIQQPMYAPVQQPISQPIQSMQYAQQYSQPQNTQIPNSQMQPVSSGHLINPMSIINDSTILDDGFFKEFEEHIRNNGVDSLTIDLMNKNLLDHMVFYHSAKSDSSPFYASGAELSHAIKIKLEELQNIERNWIMNKQKLELLKRFNSSLEYDVSVKSEELKKLVSESNKRGVNSGVSSNNSMSSISNGSVNNNSVVSSINTNPAVSSINNAPLNTNAVNNASINNSSIKISPFLGGNNLMNVASNVLPVSKTIEKFPVVASSNITAANIIVPPIASIVSSNVLSNNVSNSNISNPISASTSSSANIPKYQLSKYVINDPTKYFYARNGQIFKSLGEAVAGLNSMDNDTFSYHVNSAKNDLSKWISGVFNDYRLSESIKNLISRDRLIEYLRKTTY